MKQTVITLILFFALVFSFNGQSQNIEFTEYDLDNGLHVILHQDNSTPIVAVSIMYHVGSRNEDPERTGFAHFFEHLLFEGSANIKRGEFDKYITNAGGTFNANTSFDRTFYYEIFPSNQLELGLWLESERLMHAKIDSIGVETQRNVVKEEKRQRVDNRPYGTLMQEVFRRAYEKHPYQWMPIGSFEHLTSATLEEFMDFYETFYVPENATLSIAGDISVEEAKKLINKYFADIPSGDKEISIPDIVEPEKSKEVRDVVYDKIQLPAVVQAYHISAQGTEDAYALNILGTLLSDGQSSRMYKSLVDEQQKALAAAAFPFSLEDPGLYLMYAIANMGVDPEELEKSIDEQIELVKSELISEREFQKIRNQVENNFVSKNSTMAGIAENLANYHVYFGDAGLINTEIEKFMNVTREDIKRVANEYLRKENRVVLYYMPEEAEDKPVNNESKTEN